jgi:hypothetical protein
MKRFALVALLAAMLFGVATTVSATELKVKGSFEVAGEWGANIYDFNSDAKFDENYYIGQRLRTYFTFQTNENLKAVLGLEMDNVWGSGDTDWGTDVSGKGTGAGAIEIKHAYLDFNFPDTAINVKAGLQSVALPSVFGNPVFENDAPALIVSAPINDMVSVAVGYTRGESDDEPGATIVEKDDVDGAMLIVPVTLDGFSIAPYFVYAWVGQDTESIAVGMQDDAAGWWLGANAALTMFDPLTISADIIYGNLDTEDALDIDYTGWYGALAASYKFDMVTPTLFATYGSGMEDRDDLGSLPQLSEGWGLTPFIGGNRAFSFADDEFLTDQMDLWTVGLTLADISFVEGLSHSLTIAYAEGTSHDTYKFFSEKDSAWEVYMVNQYMIYENLAAINELGYLSPDFNEKNVADDAAYFATIGLAYKF